MQHTVGEYCDAGTQQIHHLSEAPFALRSISIPPLTALVVVTLALYKHMALPGLVP